MTAKAKDALSELTGGRLTLGKAIRSIRLSQGEKPAPFARSLGLSESLLGDLESNRCDITPEKAKELADSLGYPCQEFIRLAIQDQLIRNGMNYEIKLKPIED